MRDLNAVVGGGNNWRLPFFWAPLLRWVSAPVLISILTLSYKSLGDIGRNKDPLHCFSFAVAHVGIVLVVVGFVFPEALDFLIPRRESGADQKQYAMAPGLTLPVEEDAVVAEPAGVGEL